ncbi:phosphoribosyltransferase [Pseudohalocynthiibacter aestuariivivens]|jgi:putative phosphoribosyl transferase|uniref:Phosphoribosyltransferase n=1 Tax=Pseudohalocynthiibacter aestuariivivens TaxID=1591409 RepID=A0ABV5JHJ2_9RHOB|nr:MULTISPECIES: phosphoribosyltransferase family protein [Pseudohalocynthiibacter]MBS9717802.1 phosphoribosyltransferase [Pseudohalocynthiibacter aestuariivivens]MCK0103048.1 phosphoribosyltransferase [Pseudohalocynthiibacter sp. F2068]
MTWRRNMYNNRADAGALLAEALPTPDPKETVVIALPRGGVPVAAEICRAFDLPLDLAFVRKIGAPGQPELAVGAIVDGDQPMIEVNERIARAFELSKTDIKAMGAALLPEIERRKELYLGGRPRPSLKGKTLVVVDDGVATGATLRAALKALRQKNAARLILALPVAPPGTIEAFKPLADEMICLMTPGSFMSVGAYYHSFPQVSDAEVIAIMEQFSEGRKSGA